METNISEVRNIETVALPAFTNISNIKWLLIDLKIVQLSMLQTQHMSAEGVCNNYRSPSHAYLWTTPEDFIHLLHEGLMLIVCYIKPERSEGRENSCTFSVSSQGRKRINQVQTSLAHENVTVVWPDVLWKTRIISLRLPQHQQDWYVPFSKICKLTRSPILNERRSCTEPLPWLARDKTPRVVPGELVNIIFVLMSGFVNAVDMPK